MGYGDVICRQLLVLASQQDLILAPPTPPTNPTQPRFRSLWERYCRGVQAIVYVVDAADVDNLEVGQGQAAGGRRRHFQPGVGGSGPCPCAASRSCPSSRCGGRRRRGLSGGGWVHHALAVQPTMPLSRCGVRLAATHSIRKACAMLWWEFASWRYVAR